MSARALAVMGMVLAIGCNAPVPTQEPAPAAAPREPVVAAPVVVGEPGDPPRALSGGLTGVTLELTRGKALSASFALPAGFALQQTKPRMISWSSREDAGPPWLLSIHVACAGTCKAAALRDNVETHVAQLAATRPTKEFEVVLGMTGVTASDTVVLDEQGERARLWGRMRTYSEPRPDLPPETAELHCFVFGDTGDAFWELRLHVPAAAHVDAIEQLRAACNTLRAG
ncbi:MAG: hypothetical protein U0168_01875 [Nannocystaceae bacterium]